MEWLYKEESCNNKDIEIIESTLKIKLPKEYIKLIFENNGAYPELKNYKVNNEEKVAQSLLSCKIKDDNNIIEIAQSINLLGIVPFMSDPFGNYICFQFNLDNTYNVIYYNHETKQKIDICTNLNDFLNNLY